MIRPDVMQSFVDAFADAGFKASAFLPSYGLAEATLAVSIMPPGEGIVVELVEETELSGGDRQRRTGPQRYRAIVNCGKPCATWKSQIRDEDGTPLPDRAIGKVWCSGPSVMVGYFRDQEATDACLVDGWLDTGDMGYMSDGYVYIVGRAKDMIIINGKNHWPRISNGRWSSSPASRRATSPPSRSPRPAARKLPPCWSSAARRTMPSASACATRSANASAPSPA
jgi:fatty-acyl-CoA synthase